LWKARPHQRGILFFSGLLYGLAFLMKQQGVFFGVFGAGVLTWRVMRNRNTATVDLLKTFFAFGTGMILPFSLICLILKLAGAFHEFWFWTFKYAHSYVALTSFHMGVQLLWAHLKWNSDLSMGLWLLAIMGLLVALGNKAVRSEVAFAVFFWACSFLATATGFYFRDHYFILVLPAFSILLGLGVDSLQKALRSKLTKSAATTIPLILFAGVLTVNILGQRNLFFQLPVNQVSEAIYAGEALIFSNSLVVAGYIKQHSSKDARVAILGSEPQIYFYAQRHSVTGYIYTYALMEAQPYALTMQQEMMKEIISGKPEYLVFFEYPGSWLKQPSSPLAIFQWFDAYSKEFYEKVGVLVQKHNEAAVFLWDDDAKKHPDSAKPLLEIYRLKPASNVFPLK
jgi:hypothetical protein